MAKIQFQHPARVVCFAVGAKGGEALHALDDSVSTPTGPPICVCRDCHVRILCNRFHRARVAVLSGVPTLPRNDLYIQRITMHAKPFFVLAKNRTCLLHCLPEFRAVIVMDQMAQLMDYYVVDDRGWCDDDLPVEQQLPLRRTATPSAFEGANAD